MRFLLLLPMLSLGCSQDPIEALESYATEVCECEDAACIESVRESWEEENVDLVATADLSEEDKASGLAAVEKALACQSSIAP